jgi:hypothetical protein
MLRKFILLTALIGLFAFGCSKNDSIVSSGNPDNSETAGISQEFKTFVQDAVQSENPEAESDIAAKIRGRGFEMTPITGPTTITSPGAYYLDNDFMATEDGIIIQSDWVVLDLGDHTITGPGNKMGNGIMIDGASWVFISHGHIETFGTGVLLEHASHSAVQWVEIQGGDEFADPANGVAPQIGIQLRNSEKNFLYKNDISLINLGIFVRGGGSGFNHVWYNEVMGGDRGLLGICYNPIPDEGDAGPRNDLVKFNKLYRFGAGIQTNAGVRNRFILNDIQYFNQAIEDNSNGSNKFVNNHSEQIAPPVTSVLTLNFNGLENLGPDYMYEGWIIVGGNPVSIGRFSVDDDGNPSQMYFSVNSDDLMMATKFVLTIEPEPDPDPAPASTHYLAGDFSDGMASLTVADPAALGNDFMAAEGPYILNTPSTASDDTDYDAGIWWLDPDGGPSATLVLPDLPAGWEYEGWVVGPSGPITTGKFTAVDMEDSDGGGPTAGPDPTPPFPGQDYIDPLMPLIGYAAVITIEPMPDNSAAPFTLKPLIDSDIEDVGIGVLQPMDNNAASFPTGSANR